MISESHVSWLVISLVLGTLLLAILLRFTRSVASPYIKVDLRLRYLAAAIDVALCLPALAFLTSTAFPVTAILGSVYLLTRDGLVGGRSVGKMLTGLAVIQADSRLPCTLWRSVLRNILFVVPGLNIAALVFEAITIRRDELGMRLGDRLARTQVVLGKDVKESVRDSQDHLMPDLIQLGQDVTLSQGRALGTVAQNQEAGRHT